MTKFTKITAAIVAAAAVLSFAGCSNNTSSASESSSAVSDASTASAASTAEAAKTAGRGQVNEWLADKEYSSDGVHLDVIPISDTAHYVNKIDRAMDTYKKLYDEKG